MDFNLYFTYKSTIKNGECISFYKTYNETEQIYSLARIYKKR